MRNELITWDVYVSRIRAATGLSRPKFAAKIGVDSTTLWRWETGRQKPESKEAPEAIARVFGVDADAALAAAGLRTAAESPVPLPSDPAVDLITQSDLPARVKSELIAHVHEQRERDAQRLREDLQRMIRIAGGSA